MEQYLGLVRDVLENGNVRMDRTNTGTVSVFGRQLRFDLSDYKLPIVTTKKIFLRGLIEENLWMLRGSTDNTELTDLNVHIWDGWAVREEDKANYPEVKVGELGPVYGSQWRAWRVPNSVGTRYTLPIRFDMAEYLISMNLTEGKYTLQDLQQLRETYELGSDKPEVKRAVYDCLTRWGVPQSIEENRTVDQISELIKGLREKPYSRRHIVSAWNVADLPDESKSPQQNALMGKMALAPCHTLFQFYVRNRSIQDMRAELSEAGQAEYTRFTESHGVPYPGISFDFGYRKEIVAFFNQQGINDLKLDCQLYQR